MNKISDFASGDLVQFIPKEKKSFITIFFGYTGREWKDIDYRTQFVILNKIGVNIPPWSCNPSSMVKILWEGRVGYMFIDDDYHCFGLKVIS